jgi:nucleoside 2-deoxyribosyltransferase
MSAIVLRYETPVDSIKYLISSNNPIIFLAGPTVRGNQTHLTSWRFAAIEEFNKQGFDGYLIVPEFVSRTESDKGRTELPLWELAGLKVCDVIMFWIPRTRELPGQTTNQELGYWMARKREKVIYGRPDDAYRIQYQDIMWEADANDRNKGIIPIKNTLEATIKESIAMANFFSKSKAMRE